MEHKRKILIVEDEGIIAEDLRWILTRLGYVVSAVATSGLDALQMVSQHKPDLVLMDIMLPGEIYGIETAQRIRRHFDIPVVYLTAQDNKTIMDRAINTKPMGYILKPFTEKELYTAIEIALNKYEIETKLKFNAQWLFATLKSIGDGVIATDIHGQILFINPVAEAMTGWTQGAVKNRFLPDVFKILDYKTGQPVDDLIEDLLKRGQAFENDNCALLVDRDGFKRCITHSCAPILDNERNLTGIVLVFRDAHIEREVVANLKRTADRYKDLMNRVAGIVCELDPDGTILFVSSAVSSVTGYFPFELKGKTWWDVFIPEQNQEEIQKLYDVFLSGNVRHYKMVIKTKEGTLRTLDINSSNRYTQQGKLRNIVFSGVDITDYVNHMKALESLSLVDELTGLNNRRGFIALSQQQLKLADRNKKELLLFFADVDNLKWINDNHGHYEGDYALIEVARALKDTFRKSDILARLGGDEFAVLVVDAAQFGADVILARLEEKLKAFNSKPRRRYQLSLSIGIVSYDPNQPCSLEQLLFRADKLMYEHKRKKKDNL